MNNATEKDLHRIVAACIVHRIPTSGIPEYLVLKRRNDISVYPGLWTVPAGGLEREDYEHTVKTSPDGWENVLDATIRREVLEEGNVLIGELTRSDTFVFIRPDDIPVFGMRYSAPYLSGEAKFEPTEATEIRWIRADELDGFSFLGSIPQEIRMLDERLRDGI